MCLTTIGRPSGIWRSSITGCRRRFGSNNSGSGSGSLSHVPLIRTRPCEAELSGAVCALLNGRVDLESELRQAFRVLQPVVAMPDAGCSHLSQFLSQMSRRQVLVLWGLEHQIRADAGKTCWTHLVPP